MVAIDALHCTSTLMKCVHVCGVCACMRGMCMCFVCCMRDECVCVHVLCECVVCCVCVVCVKENTE